MKVYPLIAARTLALHAQGLTVPNATDANPSLDRIYRVVNQLNYVQMDSLTMVHRSHHLVPWSRLGSYRPADLDQLIYSPDHRRLFEGVQSIAAIIPIKDFRYQLRQGDRRHDQLIRWYDNMLDRSNGHTEVPLVLERIRQEGALKASDFEYEGPKRGSWWDWKPTKTALEYLFINGDLMVTNRVNFHRVYDLTERVLPAWVDTTPVTIEERDRYWTEQGLVAVGICLPSLVTDYGFHMRGGFRRTLWKDLLNEGVAVPVQVMLANGDLADMVVHRDQLDTLQMAAEGVIKAQRTTFLSYFDSLFWCRGRDLLLWNYHNLLEAYVPASKRKYGYFCLSILYHDRLVGRFDPKLERKDGILRIKALYLEDGVEPEDELVSGVAAAMRDFMQFHNTKELLIEKSLPDEFGEKLLKSI